MNKKIIIFSIIISILFSVYLYSSYKNKSSNKYINEETIYLLQIGAYKNTDNVTKVTRLINYNYVEYDNGIYYIYIAITKDNEVLSKLKEYYSSRGNDIYVKEKKINNKSFLEYLSKYDNMIKETNDKELIEAIEKDILKKYEKII